MFSPVCLCMSFGSLDSLFVCQKDYAKNTKIGGRMGHGPRKDPEILRNTGFSFDISINLGS